MSVDVEEYCHHCSIDDDGHWRKRKNDEPMKMMTMMMLMIDEIPQHFDLILVIQFEMDWDL